MGNFSLAALSGFMGMGRSAYPGPVTGRPGGAYPKQEDWFPTGWAKPDPRPGRRTPAKESEFTEEVVVGSDFVKRHWPGARAAQLVADGLAVRSTAAGGLIMNRETLLERVPIHVAANAYAIRLINPAKPGAVAAGAAEQQRRREAWARRSKVQARNTLTMNAKRKAEALRREADRAKHVLSEVQRYHRSRKDMNSRGGVGKRVAVEAMRKQKSARRWELLQVMDRFRRGGATIEVRNAADQELRAMAEDRWIRPGAWRVGSVSAIAASTAKASVFRAQADEKARNAAARVATAKKIRERNKFARAAAAARETRRRNELAKAAAARARTRAGPPMPSEDTLAKARRLAETESMMLMLRQKQPATQARPVTPGVQTGVPPLPPPVTTTYVAAPPATGSRWF